MPFCAFDRQQNIEGTLNTMKQTNRLIDFERAIILVAWLCFLFYSNVCIWMADRAGHTYGETKKNSSRPRVHIASTKWPSQKWPMRLALHLIGIVLVLSSIATYRTIIAAIKALQCCQWRSDWAEVVFSLDFQWKSKSSWNSINVKENRRTQAHRIIYNNWLQTYRTHFTARYTIVGRLALDVWINVSVIKLSR